MLAAVPVMLPLSKKRSISGIRVVHNHAQSSGVFRNRPDHPLEGDVPFGFAAGFAKKEVYCLMTMHTGALPAWADFVLRRGQSRCLQICTLYFVKRCILNGWSNWLHAVLRLNAETMIVLEVVGRRQHRTT